MSIQNEDENTISTICTLENNDIKEAHQKMLEYMYLNNRAPQDDFAGDEIGRYEVKRSED